MPDNVSSKPMSLKDFQQVLRSAFNDGDKAVTTSGFLDSKVGHKITVTNVNTTTDDYRSLDVVNTQTAVLTTGSPIVTLSDTSGMSIDQYLFLTIGTPGIPDNTTILSVDSSTQLTMSAAFTGVTGSYTFRVANLIKRIRLLYSNAAHDQLLDSERVE